MWFSLSLSLSLSLSVCGFSLFLCLFFCTSSSVFYNKVGVSCINSWINDRVTCITAWRCTAGLPTTGTDVTWDWLMDWLIDWLTGSRVSQPDAVLLGYPLQVPMSHEIDWLIDWLLDWQGHVYHSLMLYCWVTHYKYRCHVRFDSTTWCTMTRSVCVLVSQCLLFISTLQRSPPCFNIVYMKNVCSDRAGFLKVSVRGQSRTEEIGGLYCPFPCLPPLVSRAPLWSELGSAVSILALQLDIWWHQFC